MTRPALAAAALLLLLTIPAASHAQPRSVVTVSVTDLRSVEGQLVVCLWRERRGFPDCREGDGVPRHTYPVTARSMRVTIPLPQAGQYAVTVFHDENRNGRLNQNFIGMPTEGVAVSNNPGGMPRFASSLVALEPGSTVSVRMRYLFD